MKIFSCKCYYLVKYYKLAVLLFSQISTWYIINRGDIPLNTHLVKTHRIGDYLLFGLVSANEAKIN